MRSSERRPHRGALAALAALLGAGPLLAPAPAGGAVVNRIVATVDGQPITQHQLDAFIRTNAGGIAPEAVSDADRRRVLDLLINDLIVQVESEAAGATPTKEEVDAYIEQIKKRNNLSDERLLQALEAQHLTLEAYREQVRKELQRSALVSRQIRARVNVSPEEVERYYKEHQDEFAVAESIRVQHLFFPLPADASQAQVEAVANEAKQAWERLNKGESFEEVARDAAAGPAHGTGGDLGTVRKGQMVPQLEEVAFRLKAGEPSTPLRSEAGIHILVVSERVAAGATSLDEVKEQIKEKLYGTALEQRYQRWIDEDLRKSHEVVIK